LNAVGEKALVAQVLAAAAALTYRPATAHDLGQQGSGLPAVSEKVAVPAMGGEEGVATGEQMGVEGDRNSFLTDTSMYRSRDQTALMQIEQCFLEASNEQ
jgi:hypothetical protein